MSTSNKKVCIVVFGDIGRSPRMQYHALSLVKEGYHIDIVGYSGSQPITQLLESSNVHFKYLQQVPDFRKYCPHLISFVLKVLFQLISLYWCLNVNLTYRPSYLLLQNPPAIPTMFICWLYCFIYRVRFIIDWHNYAYTILSLSLTKRHKLVMISEIYEKYFGKFSNYNLCVTNAMKNDLAENWNIRATTLHDKPMDMFKPTSNEDKHNLLTKLGIDYPELLKFINLDKSDKLYPGFLVSSTSWTEDEDFSILFNALSLYDEDSNVQRPLVVVVTGKGPMKEHYLNQIKSKSWSKITIYTPWLTAEDYPRLIGCADLGVSLHTSSSGLDLPMKVVDMFGCCVPVCAKNFKCLNELVQHEINGFVFDTEQELANQLKIWFKNESIQKTIKENVSKFRLNTWEDNWKKNALPLFQ